MEGFDVPAYKIASFEIQDTPLIEYTASKGKPIIISTGIATEEDIKLAVDTCRAAGNNQIILLKCTSSYPAPIELANLNTIPDLKTRFGVEAGLSDHTRGIVVPAISVAVGGKVIEKHFILDKKIGGPDVEFSLDPKEFREMVDSVRAAESALGIATYEMDEKVKKNRQFARSLFVVKDVDKGEVFTEENVRSIRPGNGLHPKFLKDVLGKKATVTVERGTPLMSHHFS